MNDQFFPNLKTPVAENGTIFHATDAQIASLYPRVNGTGSIALSGSISNGDVLTATFSSKLFTGGSTAVSVTAASDTLATLADKLAAAILANTTLAAFGLIAESDPTAGKVDLIWPGPLGSFVTITDNSTGSESFVLTQISGGSGPIIPQDNLRFAYNNGIIQMVAYRAVSLSSDALKALVAAGPLKVQIQ